MNIPKGWIDEARKNNVDKTWVNFAVSSEQATARAEADSAGFDAAVVRLAHCRVPALPKVVGRIKAEMKKFDKESWAYQHRRSSKKSSNTSSGYQCTVELVTWDCATISARFDPANDPRCSEEKRECIVYEYIADHEGEDGNGGGSPAGDNGSACEPDDSGGAGFTDPDGVPVSCDPDPCESDNPPFYCNLDEEEFSECVKEATVSKFSESAGEAAKFIFPEVKKAELTVEQTSYVLSTIRFESRFGAKGGMVEDNPRIGFYEKNENIGNTEPGDGSKFIGRGYIQLTGREPYKRLGNRLGIDLVNNVHLATDKSIAAKIAVIGMKEGLFTGVGLQDYIK